MRRTWVFVLACVTFAGVVWLLRPNRSPEPAVGPPPGPRLIAEEPSPTPLPAPLAASDPHPLPEVLIDPSVVVEKGRRALTVYSDGHAVKVYRIALGREPAGDKEVEGDGKTPEGEFYVCLKNPASQFHRALGLSYPAEDDAERGLAAGLISSREHRQILEALRRFAQPPWRTALGGEIMVHGGGTASDWTEGCIALDDAEAEELFDALPLGTPVTIEP